MTSVSILTTINKLNDFRSSYLESIARQTFNGTIEIIIVADTHNNVDLLEIYQFSLDLQKKLNIKVNFLRSPVVDRGASLNLGIASSKCNYVAIHDLDDFWLPTKIEHQVYVLEGQNVDIVATSYTILADCTALSLIAFPVHAHRSNIPYVSNLSIRDFMLANPLAHSSICFRRASGLRYREKIHSQYDYCFYVDALLSKHKIATIKRNLTLIAHHSTNSFMKKSAYLYKIRFASQLVSFWSRIIFRSITRTL